MGRIDIRIVEARNLPNVEMVGTSSPYITVELENAKHETTVAKETLNPKYAEVLKFSVADPESSQAKIKVWSKGALTDSFMGEYDLAIAGLTKGVTKEWWCLLEQCKSQGEVRVQALAIDFGIEPEPQQQQVAAVSGDTHSSWSNKKEEPPVPVVVPQQPAAPPAMFAQPQWNPEIESHKYHEKNVVERAADELGKGLNSLMNKVGVASTDGK